MATAGVRRRNQVRLLGSNQQPSRPIRRLLRGGWNPTHSPFRAQRGRADTVNQSHGPQTLGCVSRPEAGPGNRGGAGAQGRDPQQYDYCKGPQAQPSSSPGKQPAAFTPTRKAANERLDPHAQPFSGLVWSSRYSQSNTRVGDARGRSQTRDQPGRGPGLMLRDVTPNSRATEGVPRRNQVHLLGSNQQPSRPVRILLRGGWTPTHGPIQS